MTPTLVTTIEQYDAQLVLALAVAYLAHLLAHAIIEASRGRHSPMWGGMRRIAIWISLAALSVIAGVHTLEYMA